MKKIIAWESWSEKEKELVDLSDLENYETEVETDSEQIMQSENFLSPLFGDMKPQIIQTPWGTVSFDSILKPSDRWDCWLGYTNFGVTHKISDKIKTIEGVEAIKVMSRYTFCIGIGKLFEFSSVRKDIENAICKQ
jgi:hypothetical protein